MTNTYSRCKGCGKPRTPENPVSGNGLCIDCRRDRAIRLAELQADLEREALALLAERATTTPENLYRKTVRIKDIR